ncbi:Nif11-like leader peptide family RiPP precursor [Parabacteroides sp.]
MTLQEFIEKVKTDEALKAKVDAAVLEKVLLPMAQAEGVELSEEELNGIAGGLPGLNGLPSLRPAFHF